MAGDDEYALQFPLNYRKTYADLIFRQKQDIDGRRQEAVDAIAFLEAHGVVSTPGFFWYAESGERLIDAIKRKHQEEMFRAEDIRRG